MKVAVVGAGFAGLAAAILLLERRHDVTLLERRGILGGRASSYPDAVTGDEVDSGPGLLFPGSSATLSLLKRAGADELLSAPGVHGIELRQHNVSSPLAAAALPAPWHAAVGMLGLRLPWPQRIAAFRLVLRAAATPATGSTLAEQLSSQPDELRHLLWDPLCTLLLNDTPERVDARLAANLCHELLRERGSCRPILPRVGLGRIASRLARYFEARGGRLRRRALVQRVDVGLGRVTGVRYVQRAESKDEIRAGRPEVHEQLTVQSLVLAVPWKAVPFLLPEPVRSAAPFARMSALGSSPSVSIELWLDRPAVDGTIVALPGREVEWVLNKSRLRGDSRPGQHLSCIVSARERRRARTNAEWQDLADQSLRRSFPAMADRHIIRALVLRDPDAAFACDPEATKLRPGAETPLAGLFLAGDWTDTGLPSCIEGAVRSGVRAAEAVERC